MTRKNIVAGNWKMNTSMDRGLALAKEIEGIAKHEVMQDSEIILFPPFTSLAAIIKLLAGNPNIKVGAQNCHHEENGAFTGSISADMIASVGATHVIIGHSERRQFAHEDNLLLAQKIDLALKNNLVPIYCFGETLLERNSGEYLKVITDQVEEGLFHLSKDEFNTIILAYEPIWAIGTGETASPHQANEIHALVRKQIEQKYGSQTAANIRILYGGSVKPNNANELFSQSDIDGGLIGGAALDARSFIEIIKHS